MFRVHNLFVGKVFIMWMGKDDKVYNGWGSPVTFIAKTILSQVNNNLLICKENKNGPKPIKFVKAKKDILRKTYFKHCVIVIN